MDQMDQKTINEIYERLLGVLDHMNGRLSEKDIDTIYQKIEDIMLKIDEYREVKDV